MEINYHNIQHLGYAVFHEKNEIDMLTTGKQNNDFFHSMFYVLCFVFHSTLLRRLITPENKHQQKLMISEISKNGNWKTMNHNL